VSAAIWLLLLVPFALGLAVQGLVRSVFRRYSAVPNHSGVTGADAARSLLDAHGLQRVVVELIPGFLTDHYDGQAKALRLSEPVGRERSVSALGITGHEVSHAYQDAEGSPTYRSRQSIGEHLAVHRLCPRRAARTNARRSLSCVSTGSLDDTASSGGNALDKEGARTFRQ